MDTNDKKSDEVRVGDVNIKISAGESFTHGFFFAVGAIVASVLMGMLITSISILVIGKSLGSFFSSTPVVKQSVRQIPNL